MSENKLESVATEVSKECKKELQKSAIDDDVSLKDFVRDILEKYVAKKLKRSNEININE